MFILSNLNRPLRSCPLATPTSKTGQRSWPDYLRFLASAPPVSTSHTPKPFILISLTLPKKTILLRQNHGIHNLLGHSNVEKTYCIFKTMLNPLKTSSAGPGLPFYNTFKHWFHKWFPTFQLKTYKNTMCSLSHQSNLFRFVLVYVLFFILYTWVQK